MVTKEWVVQTAMKMHHAGIVRGPVITCELLLKHKAEINEQPNIAVSESDEESNDQLCF